MWRFAGLVLALQTIGYVQKCRHDPVNVIIIGCGVPGQSIGWFHATQLMESVCGNVIAIVEPWFLGEGAGSPGSDKFLEFKTTLEGAGTRFY